MPKKKGQKDEEREDRISMEAIVDAYGPEEQAMGWYYYLQDKISFPFQGKCILACIIHNDFGKSPKDPLCS